MRVVQEVFDDYRSQTWNLAALQELQPHLVLAFGSIEFFGSNGFADSLRSTFSDAVVVGCSTAGEITFDGVRERSCVVTAMSFDHTHVGVVHEQVMSVTDSKTAGQSLGRQLEAPDLCAILVFSKGLDINGSDLISGILECVSPEIPIAGGLAGDNGLFQKTAVLTPSGVFDDQVVAVGLYGNRLNTSCGSFGGWLPFGPVRKVTHAQGNMLYELDGEPVLAMYKRYLGDYAKDLPASGLLFPFEMLNENYDSVGIIRTILGVNETDGSLMLAGSVAEQGFLRLMHASPDALVRGAEQAVGAALGGVQSRAEFALLVSCVGRKLVMGEQTDDEIDAVVGHLPHEITVSGFYSYGEICPLQGSHVCHLHNQTMTVTIFSEA